jgi:NAD(P)-dependent dehydrogenase (short-subunit alcohol dehydrogenase family)
MTAEMQPLFDISGKVALVTGGGSGLGREFCDVLAEFGADVATCARRKNHVEETCDIISKYGHRTLALGVDVSEYDEVRAMFKQIEDTFGRLDILVNNAGVTTRGAVIDKIDVSEWHRLINIDLHGVFYCMKEGLKIMMKQKKGSIINIASTVGVLGLDATIESPAPYVAAKSAVIGLTKQGAADYAQYGIRVNSIAPGWHKDTQLAENAGSRVTEADLKDFDQTKIIPRTPMRRRGERKELRGLLIYLASDASSFLTGQTINHDGGWTAV